jgi:hypothetical protein
VTALDIVMDDIAGELETLRQGLPDPFDMPEALPAFFGTERAAAVVAGGRESAEGLIRYLEAQPAPALARVAVILLSRFPLEWFYPRLLDVLRVAGPPLVAAMSAGWWLLDRAHDELARDIVGTVSPEHPSPLLLLQHPAARHVKPALAGFAQARQSPLSRYALSAMRYALEPHDAATLRDLSQWSEDVEAAALAGLLLLELGSREGLAGVRTGLAAPAQGVRESTYYELSRFLPRAVIEQAGYDPTAPGEVQQTAIDAVLAGVQNR